MDLPGLSSQDFSGKRVLVRLDLDIPESESGLNTSRLEAGLSTLNELKEKASKLILLGHMGRPARKAAPIEAGKPENYDESLSTEKLLPFYKEKLGDVGFADSFENIPDTKFVLFENLRFWPEEKDNDAEFAKKLANLGDFFINDSFAVSHRESASIVGLPKLLPSAFGERFLKEIENLSRVFNNPARPVVVTLSGVKEDKLKYLDNFKEKADKILVAGRLGEFLGEDYKDDKVILAKLLQDKEDITLNSIEKFENEIETAKTILVSGPMGKFEEEGHRQGTERVFKKIAESSAFKVAGGGDTENALELLGLKDKFDWVSTGGGAMLEFLSLGTLPGIEVIVKNNL